MTSVIAVAAFYPTPREACLLEERGRDEPGRAAFARVGRGESVVAAEHAREGRGLAEAAHRRHVGDCNADAACGREQARARSSRAVQIVADTLWPRRANTRESEAREQPSAAA